MQVHVHWTHLERTSSSWLPMHVDLKVLFFSWDVKEDRTKYNYAKELASIYRVTQTVLKVNFLPCRCWLIPGILTSLCISHFLVKITCHSVFIYLLRGSSLNSLKLSLYSSELTGETGTTNFRIVFKDGDNVISPWHDIPLKNGELFNFVNEIPKYSKVI